MANIIDATSFDKGIEIISESDVWRGIYFLRSALLTFFGDNLDDISLVPIAQGGNRVGFELALAPPGTATLELNSMEVKHYPPASLPLEKAYVARLPDMDKILKADETVKKVVFAEAVVESQDSIKAAMAGINKAIDQHNQDFTKNYPYPAYYTLALINKINGLATIPNLTHAYDVDKNIWVWGWGCDMDDKGRANDNIMGMLALNHVAIPHPPYATPSSTMAAWLKRD